jgi:ABC-type uncharacterized transport system fused permease/ATPase subunit
VAILVGAVYGVKQIQGS